MQKAYDEKAVMKTSMEMKIPLLEGFKQSGAQQKLKGSF